MDFLKVITTSPETVVESFDRIAKSLFNEYVLQVNSSYFRLIDIEFYYYTENELVKENVKHQDIYCHKHQTQLSLGKWYFHDSGIDITFGNESNDYGGILIRGIAKIDQTIPDNNFIEYQVHGPLKVRAKITDNFNGVVDDSPNFFRLIKIGKESNEYPITPSSYIVKTNRINLNPQRDSSEQFLNRKYRYVILLDKYQFGYTKKTQIAINLKEQFNLTNDQVNKLLGSKFL